MITQFISTVKIYSVHANPSVITYSYVTFSCVKKTLRYVPGAVDVILVEKTCVRRTCYCKRRAKMYTLPGSPRTLPPTFLRRASSWSRMPLAVVSTITPNYERQKDGLKMCTFCEEMGEVTLKRNKETNLSPDEREADGQPSPPHQCVTGHNEGCNGRREKIVSFGQHRNIRTHESLYSLPRMHT